MLFLLLNLALVWCLVMLYFTVRPDQLAALMLYMNELEDELLSLFRRLEEYNRHGRASETELAELKRQKRQLKLKSYMLMIVLHFLNTPFAVARFLLAPFRKKE